MMRTSCIPLLLFGLVTNAVFIHAQDPIWSCGFEGNNLCSATLHEQRNATFEFNKGATPSDNTGPDFDNTFKSPEGTYIYLEATGKEQGDQAVLMTPTFPTGKQKCIKFFYHMYSGSVDHMGTLRVVALPFGKVVFNVSGTQGEEWKQARVDLEEDVKQLNFTAIRGFRYQSDIALDDIVVTAGGCEGGSEEDSGRSRDDQNPPEEGMTTEKPPEMRPGSMPSGRDSPREKPDTKPPQDSGSDRNRAARQVPLDDLDIQADLPEIPDILQRPNPPSSGPRPGMPPAQAGDPRAKSFGVRLVAGRDEYQGRLEVFYNGKWGTVCSDGWTAAESSAACKSLNLSGGEITAPPESARMLSNDPKPIWLDGVRCSRGSQLVDCCRNEFGVHDCDHSKDVYLNCGVPRQDPSEGPQGGTGAPARVTEMPMPTRPTEVPQRPTEIPPRAAEILPPRPTEVPPRDNEIPPEQPRPREGEMPAAMSPGPASRESFLLSARISKDSDFNLNSTNINGLNFTNDGNFGHRFRLVEEINPEGPDADKRYWMELYTNNGVAYARLKSRPLKLVDNRDGCLNFTILTGRGAEWIARINTEEIASGSGQARDKPEVISSSIKYSSVNDQPFNIFFEAWVQEKSDLFAVDDVIFVDAPCPASLR